MDGPSGEQAHAHRMAPRGAADSVRTSGGRDRSDLLDILQERLSVSAAPDESSPCDAVVEGLCGQLAKHYRLEGRLTAINLAVGDGTRFRRRPDIRLVWWPEGPPPGRLIGVVSSRLGRRLDARPAWFNALRSVCRAVRARSNVALQERGAAPCFAAAGVIEHGLPPPFPADADRLLSVDATASSPFVRRAGQLFGCNVLSIEVAHESVPGTVARWLAERAALPPQETARRAYLGPPLVGPFPDTAAERRGSIPPARDRLLVQLADLVCALHIRPGGHIEQLVGQRLLDRSMPAGSVWIAVGRGLVEPPLRDRLIGLGAIAWHPERRTQDATGVPHLSAVPGFPPGGVPLCEAPAVPAAPPLPRQVPWPYLTHTTRRCDGPWPGQSERDYLDDLLLARAAADHSALAALERIVRQRRIVASGRAIRGGAQVVSFTSAAPDELLQLRTFRVHRHRWDFQPYGICIRRDWLAGRGARPVYYGDQRLWQRLPPSERPFFQRRQSRGPRRRPPENWTVEREWRHPGDVDLASLPANAARLFVPTDAEADRLAPISPWPVHRLAPIE